MLLLIHEGSHATRTDKPSFGTWQESEMHVNSNHKSWLHRLSDPQTPWRLRGERQCEQPPPRFQPAGTGGFLRLGTTRLTAACLRRSRSVRALMLLTVAVGLASAAARLVCLSHRYSQNALVCEILAETLERRIGATNLSDDNREYSRLDYYRRCKRVFASAACEPWKEIKLPAELRALEAGESRPPSPVAFFLQGKMQVLELRELPSR
jgi:hypothetical protein